MIGLLQRVTTAKVRVAGETVGSIGTGLLVLIGMERGDGKAEADRLLERLLNYRVFPDCDGKMNNALRDIQGDLMLVSQFTLAADTAKGNRPSFTPALSPEEAGPLFAYLLERAQAVYGKVESGRFGADMQVSLINDGPVTFTLRVPPTPRP
ncbi:MAG: D-tyrosyl-tRNA(Tyr) deacylase [Gammaproteobacteria bacterium]|nr:D-tyrosyl-tRNA(Tyr) deacylase [Gammaproteobacteria bacterium]MCP5136195.1 D-tyrosyl-tRNA(Tyr) deacylase [Gammaproteobacteria bacterium]